MSPGALTDPAEAFAEIGRIRLGDTDIAGVLNTIAALAKRTLPGADEVSVTLVHETSPETAAFTGALALRLDESQYDAGYGPCLDAARTASTVSVPEISSDQRWPQWTRRAREGGVGSSLSVGLPVQEKVTGALNVYARKPRAFDDDAITLAETFADYAAVALANAHLYAATTTLAEQMRAAMASRAVIEQAKGIIMATRRCTAEEAFRVLTTISQNTNKKLRDVAAALVAEAGGESKP